MENLDITRDKSAEDVSQNTGREELETLTDHNDAYNDEGNYDDSYDDNYDIYYYDGNERLDVKEDELKIREIPLPKSISERYDFIDKLPSNIAVMGGVARSIAREILTGEKRAYSRY